MTLLSAVQSASIRLIGKKPVAIFSAQDTFSLEMQDLSNEVSQDIAKSHDWQALTAVNTLTGDGTATAFPFPDDYDRMLIDSSVYDPQNWAWGYDRIIRLDQWLEWEIRDWQLITPGAWTILRGEFEFIPAPPNGQEAKFVYIHENRVLGGGSTPQALFTGDSDTFVLSERLLTLGIIWKWREMKRLESSTDQANFQKAFDELAGRDKGSRILAEGRARFPGNVSTAYPWPLGS